MSSVGKNSLIMASGTLASRLTGMIRSILLAAALGTTGIAANAYQTGSTVPQVVYTLISGGLFNAILVPQIVRTLKSENSKEQLDKLVTLSMVILLGMTAAIMASTHLITSLFLSSEWSGPQRALANAFTLWCTPQIFFYGLYTVLGQILAAKDKFGMYAWSSVAANVVSCAGFIAFLVIFGNASRQPLEFWTADKITLTAGAWTAGVALQALLLFIPLLRSGYRFSFAWGVRGIGLRSMGSVAVWSLGITIMIQITSILITRIASGAPLAAGDLYGVAGNGSYQNAMTIYILPYSLFAVSIATAIFPRMSHHISEDHTDTAARILSTAMISSSLIMCFFTSVMLAISFPLTAVFLPSIDGYQMSLISPILFALTFCLPFTSLVLLAQRSFYAFEDGKSPFVIAAVQSGIQFLIQIATWLWVPPQHQTAMLGYAVSISYMMCLPVLLVMLYKRFGTAFHIGHFTVTHIKIALASCITFLAAWMTSHGLSKVLRFTVESAHGKTAWLIAVLICWASTVAGALAFSLILLLTRTPEFSDNVATVARRLRLDRYPVVSRILERLSSSQSSNSSSTK